MRVALGLSAMLVLSILPPPAYAQVPQGSYLQSCRDIKMQGQTLAAVCRRGDGREQGSYLADANRCTGDIGNNNGTLQCSRGSGGPAPAAPAPGYSPQRGQTPPPVAPAPGYSPPYGQAPPPGYPSGGDRRWSEEQAYQERCERLGHEERELRARLQYTPYGEERERLQYRLGQIDLERGQCRGRR
jgi:hypothetical protein